MSTAPGNASPRADARLVVLGRDPLTALGRAMDRLAERVEDAEPGTIERRADPSSLLVIGASAADPLGLAERAASCGWRVLLEPVAAGGAAGLANLVRGTPPGTVLPALRRRHEPEARWAQAAVGRGAIGLPWGAHAEALASAAPDAVADALDLADALERAAAVRLERAVRLDRPPRAHRRSGAGRPQTLLASLAFEHGVVGQLAVRAARRERGSAEALEMASLRVTGSHGTVLAELDAPVVYVTVPGGPQRERLGPDGADRLLGAFLALAEGGSLEGLASMDEAARLLSLIEGRTRTGGER